MALEGHGLEHFHWIHWQHQWPPGCYETQLITSTGRGGRSERSSRTVREVIEMQNGPYNGWRTVPGGGCKHVLSRTEKEREIRKALLDQFKCHVAIRIKCLWRCWK